jgi:hypothetical protein
MIYGDSSQDEEEISLTYVRVRPLLYAHFSGILLAGDTHVPDSGSEATTDIVQIISERLNLQRSGANYAVCVRFLTIYRFCGEQLALSLFWL